MSSDFISAVSADAVSFDDNGLVPAIVQHAETHQVLMLGYMNADALQKTQESGKVTFWSRSRKELWVKGETSGNTLHLKDIRIDCDEDALLVRALPAGPTCHTGQPSCFYRPELPPEAPLHFLSQLQSLLQSRRKEMPEGSYTTHLFNKGLDKIAQKVGEEAVETVIAAKNEDENEFIYESSDLLFHLMVLLTERGLSLENLTKELAGRHGKKTGQ